MSSGPVPGSVDVMTNQTLPEARTHLRRAQLFVGAYLMVSTVTLAAIVVLRHHPTVVTPQVWVRAIIVVGTAALMATFAARAARGSAAAFLRLRLASGLMLIAIAVIITLPGGFPLWMKFEQAVCGVLLLGVVLLVNGRPVRSLFRR
jgi:hypothetical protein